MKILFYGTKKYDEEFFNALLPRFPDIQIHFLEANIGNDTAMLAKGYDAICVFVNADLHLSVLKALNECGIRLILLRCAGYNNVDLKAAAKYGMTLLRVPSYSPEAVAEHAMALVLTANRHTHKAYIKCRENNFALNGLMGVNLYRKTAGIIGTGKIGVAMARICSGFDMDVIAYDPYPLEHSPCFSYVSLEELLQKSDLISLHCPLTKDTHHLIREKTISQMKDGLDVYEEETAFVYEDLSEEILPRSTISRLLSFPNVTITSHQGFFTREALHNIAETTLENADSFQKGKLLTDRVVSLS